MKERTKIIILLTVFCSLMIGLNKEMSFNSCSEDGKNCAITYQRIGDYLIGLD